VVFGHRRRADSVTPSSQGPEKIGRTIMNKLMLCAAAVILFSSSAFTADRMTFNGEIMDSSCAAAGSHTAMMNEHKIKDARACTLGCVKNGAKYVLYDQATKTTYELDDQAKPEEFAGQDVKVRGKLDAAGKTIHVENISRS
jgi:hypothetical protein